MAPQTHTAIVSDPRYDLVSSLYGPGTVIGWVLLGLACNFKWFFPSKAQRVGLIDADFVGFVAFGAMTAGNLIATVRALDIEDLNSGDPSSKAINTQQLAALQAGLRTAETCMQICVVLLFASVSMKWIKRSATVACLGLFNFSAETFLRCRIGSFTSDLKYLDDAFLVKFGLNFTIASALVAILVLATFIILPYTGYKRGQRRRKSRARHRERHLPGVEGGLQVPDHDLDLQIRFKDETSMRSLSVMTLLSLPLALLTSSMGMPMDQMRGMEWDSVLLNLVPKSHQRLSNLDQVLALGLGSGTLMIVVVNRVHEFLDNRRVSSEQYELRRLNRQQVWPGHRRTEPD